MIDVVITLSYLYQDLSHDPEVIEKYDKDPLVRKFGTLKGLSDMLTQVTTFSRLYSFLFSDFRGLPSATSTIRTGPRTYLYVHELL